MSFCWSFVSGLLWCFNILILITFTWWCGKGVLFDSYILSGYSGVAAFSTIFFLHVIWRYISSGHGDFCIDCSTVWSIADFAGFSTTHGLLGAFLSFMKCERGGKSMELEHQPQQKLIYQMISIGIHLKLAVFLCLMSFYHFCSWCDGNKGSWWDLGTGHFEECFSSACDVCLLLRGWQLGHRLFNADSLDFPRIDTSEYPFRLCGEWMKVVYCIPSKVTVYPAIYRSCISLQGLVQGKVRDCPLNYDLV